MVTAAEADFASEFFDQLVEWVAENLDPEDVFSVDELKEWAEDNGYVAVPRG